MARRNKLIKFTEILTFPNVYENYDPSTEILLGENGEECTLKSEWASKHFGNNHPLILELACGRGEYSLALAQRYPNKNFLGVDIKGARIWKGARYALRHNIQNVAFLRTRIEMIENFIGQGEVEEIWITFPDPFLKKSKKNRRLTSPAFLKRYHNILKPGGRIHLKTDSDPLYQYTLEVIDREKHIIDVRSDDIYSQAEVFPDLDIKTYYEQKHLEDNRSIKFVSFHLDY